MKLLLLMLVVTLLFSMTACASSTSIQISLPGPNATVNQPDGQGRVARAVAARLLRRAA